MLLMILAGLWALVLGRITITSGLRLEGRRARIYGGALLAVALLVAALNRLLAPVLPAWVVGDGVASLVANLLVAGAIIVGLAIAFRGHDGGA